MVKNAIVTVLIGKRHSNMAKLTHPTQMSYALRHGLDYIVYDHEQYYIYHPDGSTSKLLSNQPVVKKTSGDFTQPSFGAYNKLNIVELLENYERILHIDTDIIIRDDAPNLFDMVPNDKIGILSEENFFHKDDRAGLIKDWCKKYNVDISKWGGKYYNTGVFVMSRGHEAMLKSSSNFYDDNFYEQTGININIFTNSLPIFELPYLFNRMSFMDEPLREPRHSSYFIHYAGSWMMLKEGHSESADFLLKLIEYDIEKWKSGSPTHAYDKLTNYIPRNYWIRD